MLFSLKKSTRNRQTSNGVKKHNLEIGYLGESIAKKYLQKKGYFIVEQNYKNKYAEIDLIARNKDTLVFVEVKTRIGEQFGTPENAINRNKMGRLIRNARAYIARARKPCLYRIDAICIVLDENKQARRIDHYENIGPGQI